MECVTSNTLLKWKKWKFIYFVKEIRNNIIYLSNSLTMLWLSAECWCVFISLFEYFDVSISDQDQV